MSQKIVKTEKTISLAVIKGTFGVPKVMMVCETTTTIITLPSLEEALLGQSLGQSQPTIKIIQMTEVILLTGERPEPDGFGGLNSILNDITTQQDFRDVRGVYEIPRPSASASASVNAFPIRLDQPSQANQPKKISSGGGVHEIPILRGDRVDERCAHQSMLSLLAELKNQEKVTNKPSFPAELAKLIAMANANAGSDDQLDSDDIEPVD